MTVRLLSNRRVASPLSAIDTHVAIEWILRVGAFLCFVGHGAFGIMTKQAWVPFFAVAGIGPKLAYELMPIIGVVDILLGALALLRPRAALLAYMVAWALWTAALRPLSGQPFWELLERAGNYGVPLGLLLLTQTSRRARTWFGPARVRPMTKTLALTLRLVLVAATALLLVGHGALALQGKQELVMHYGLFSTAVSGEKLAPFIGWVEIALAAFLIWRPTIGFCFFLFAWKFATESLFLLAGAPIWEVLERGGSYAAPLALALLVSSAPGWKWRRLPPLGKSTDDAVLASTSEKTLANLSGH